MNIRESIIRTWREIRIPDPRNTGGHRTAILVIGGVALILRVGLVVWQMDDVKPSDGLDYHNVAVNLVLGNGYSNDIQAPFEPYFFREPGYSLFIAAVYGVCSWFGEISYVTDMTDLNHHPEFVGLQMVQCTLGAIMCVVFYLTLSLVLQKRAAWVLGLLGACYVPLAAFAALPLRETLQAFVVVAMNYCFARFLMNRSARWLLAFSVALAASILILRVTILGPALAFVFFWIQFRNVAQSLKYTAMVSGVVVILILPWLLRTYSFFPNWRIIWSVGTSHTTELRDYYLALEENFKTDSDDYKRLYGDWKKLSERERFEWSFSGRVTELSNALPEPGSGGVIPKILRRWRLAWMESLWVAKIPGQRLHLRPHSHYLAQGRTGWFMASLGAMVFGHMALFGVLIYAIRLRVILFAFTYFYVIFYLIGNDPRRTLCVHVFVLMFSGLAFHYVYQSFIRRGQPTGVPKDTDPNGHAP